MIYRILKIIANMAIRLYYRKIYVDGFNRIPKNKPVFITSNHPSGFLEPIIMACLWPKPLHFLVRGDLYDKPVLTPLMKATNQIPIYRFKDGFSNLRNNHKTIDIVVEKLQKNEHVIIFIEGGTEDVKFLRPFKKGMARMSLEAIRKDHNLDLQILPVGINFTNVGGFRSDVFLNIGEPVSFKSEIEKIGDKSDNLIYKEITDRVFEVTRPMIFEEKERPHKIGKLYSNLSALLDKSGKSVIFGSNLFHKIRACVKNYQQGEPIDNLTEKNIYPKQDFLEITLATVLLPLALLGFLVYFPLMFLSYWIARKLVGSIEFLSSVRVVIFIVTASLMIALLSILAFVQQGIIWGIASFFGLLFMGFAMYYSYSRIFERRFSSQNKKLVLKLKSILET